MVCIHYDRKVKGHCELMDPCCDCEGDRSKCSDNDTVVDARNERLLKQSATLLATAGGYKERVYIVTVSGGRAVDIVEHSPEPRRKTVL